MNPKLNLIQGTCRKLAPVVRRYFGEVERTLVNPAAAAKVTDEAIPAILATLKAELGKSGLPVLTPEDIAPESAHWLVTPLSRPVNFRHGRHPVSCAMAYVDETGICTVGGIYFPLEDVLVHAETGLGSKGPERFRANTRTALEDALLCLPWKTEDVLSLHLLEKCEALQPPLHTRKTGDTLADIIAVAAGRADIAIATRLTRLETLLAKLVLEESGATVTELDGAPLTPQSQTLLAASFNLHPTALKHFQNAG